MVVEVGVLVEESGLVLRGGGDVSGVVGGDGGDGGRVWLVKQH